MKIINFGGGLGNQMFQYCYYQYLKEKYPNETFYSYSPKAMKYIHNGIEITKWFDVSLPKTSSFIYIFANCLIILQKVLKHLHININLYASDKYPGDKFIFQRGNYQNKRYRSYGKFAYKNYQDLGNENLELIKKMEETNSVAVHIRRNDYLIPAIKPLFEGLCTDRYYNTAIEAINKEVENPVFFFFTDDDIEYVKEKFPFENKVIVTGNKKERSFYDMYLMSHCKHIILANSTFSLWAAYLNSDVESVYCPIRWNNALPYPDVILDNWIKINP